MNKTNKVKTDKTRRTFIKSTGVATGALLVAPPAISMAGTSGKDQDKLALKGGTKAVTASHDDAITWPRYEAEEEKAVLEVLREPSYAPLDELEEAWKHHFIAY